MYFREISNRNGEGVESLETIESVWHFDIENGISDKVYRSILDKDCGMTNPYGSKYSVFVD